MNTKIIWISVACLFLLLTVRLFRSHKPGVQNERIEYISNLDFEFSGTLDTADRPGQVLFHITRGRINKSREIELNRSLEFNGVLDLLLYRADGKLDLMIPDPHQFNPGDSLYLNSDLGVVRFYRNGEMLSEHVLVKSLRGRPF